MNDTEKEIRSILSGCKDVSVNQVGKLWQIRVGPHSGARENGVSLAREMLGRVRKASDESAFMNEAMKEERAVDKVEPEVVYVPDPEAEARALEAEGKLQEALAEMANVKEALATRPETVMPDFEPEAEQESYDEPPAEIADLIDPDLTARQNLDALTAKYAAAKNLEEYCRSNDDMEGAMKHLRDAERFESGIKWNRAVLAEVV